DTDADVRATRFTAGFRTWSIDVAASGYNESNPSIALNPAGGTVIAIAYQKQVGGSNTDIFVARYSTGGSPVRTQPIAVTSSPNRELAPAVAIDANNNLVVAYEYEYSSSDHDIKARRVSSYGAVGPEVYVDGSLSYEANPVVALHPNTGRFVVAYERGTGPDGGGRVREFDPPNPLVGSFSAGSSEAGPAVSIDGRGNSQLVYTSLTGTATDPGLGVRRRRGSL